VPPGWTTSRPKTTIPQHWPNASMRMEGPRAHA
jgi:hypothetical protein